MPQQEYLNRTRAAARLNVSERRVLDLALRGLLRRKYIRDPDHGQKVSVFSTADIDRYMASKNALVPQPRTESAALVPTHSMPDQRLPLWLTLDQAAAWSGLPATYLLKLIRSGKLLALNVGRRPGGQWRVSRGELRAIAPTPAEIEGFTR